jgi:hypothetical protein
MIGITTAGGLPFEDSPRAIQLADGVDVGHELVAVRESPEELLLRVLLGLANADSVISGFRKQRSRRLEAFRRSVKYC